MRNISIIALAFVFILTSAMSCEKEETDVLETDGTLIFGLAYGFCQGDCAQLFKLEGDELFEDDDVDRLQIDQSINFKSTPLSNADYRLAAPLRTDFPDALINNPDTIIGIPDAYDQGGIYLQYIDGSIDRYWLLDTNVEALPEELRPYASRLKPIWEELREE